MSSRCRNRSRGRSGSVTPAPDDDCSSTCKSRPRKCRSRPKDTQTTKVKRMLNFDGEETQDSFPVTPLLADSEDITEPVPNGLDATAFPILKNVDRVPTIPGFWKDPPPPAPDFASSLQFPTSNPTRRSQRLLSKGSSTSYTVSSSSASVSFVPKNSFGFNFYKPLDRSDIPADRLSTHSDYGTSSENSFRLSNLRHHHQHKTRSTTHNASFSTNDGKSNLVPVPKVSPGGYMSDIEDELSILSDLSIQDSAAWGSEDDLTSQKLGEDENADEGFLNISNLSSHGSLKVQFLCNDEVCTLIPLDGFEFPSSLSISKDKLLHTNGSPSTSVPPFAIQVHPELNLGSLCFSRGMRVTQASNVFSLEPFGTSFCSLYPAVVSVKLQVRPCPEDEVYCLFCKDSTCDLTTTLSHWELMDDKDIRVNLVEKRVAFETTHFCTFVIMIRQVVPPETKLVRARAGGRLILSKTPGIEVNFPKGALSEDTSVTAKPFFDTEISVREFFEREAKYNSVLKNETLASPIVMFQPHGLKFHPEPVIVQLPIPDYDRIKSIFGVTAKLSIWQSDTGENEPTEWKRLNVQPITTRLRYGVTVVTFPVTHFSFFKAVWEVISKSMYEAKLGMFYYFVSFAMKCQANMEDYPEHKNFGLEVICFNSDKPWPDVQNYKHKVGQSYPKLVGPGKIFVKLKSRYFEADVEAGEDEEMTKEESDFRGKDFAKQFACK